MKYLNQFRSFDWEAFSRGKTFLSVGTRPWKDFDSGKNLGTIVDTVIYSDKTEYVRREGEVGTSNRWEKLAFKVPGTLEVPPDSQVVPEGVTATVWGEYQNNLSVKANGVRVVPRERKVS